MNHGGWLHPDRCGHVCCQIEREEAHSHVHLPDDCSDCARVNDRLAHVVSDAEEKYREVEDS